MSIEEYVKNPLWPILVETVHTIVMYPHHKFYIQSIFLSEKPDAPPQDLALDLGISLGEAIVILYELKIGKEEESK
ncbi:MAG: hypothetical protein V1850_05785 [Candidatus Bathyarchaeota archaeon]